MCDFSGDGNLEVKYVNIAVPSPLVTLLFYLNTSIYSALKGLYGSYVSFFVMKHNKKLLVNDKLTLCQTKYVDPNIISNIIQTTKLNFHGLKGFQKPHLQSVCAIFKFFHLYLLLYYILINCFIQFVGSSHYLNNCEKFHDTAPFNNISQNARSVFLVPTLCLPSSQSPP